MEPISLQVYRLLEFNIFLPPDLVPYHLLITRRRIVGGIIFSSVLEQYEIQLVHGFRVVDSISYHDNHCATTASNLNSEYKITLYGLTCRQNQTINSKPDSGTVWKYANISSRSNLVFI